MPPIHELTALKALLAAVAALTAWLSAGLDPWNPAKVARRRRLAARFSVLAAILGLAAVWGGR